MIESQIAQSHHLITFIDSNAVPLFQMESGKNVIITDMSGDKTIKRCTYLDAQHILFGERKIHIADLAKELKQQGAECTPESYITDLQLYPRFYPDRTLRREDGRYIPYSLLSAPAPIGRSAFPYYRIAICPEAIHDRQVYLQEGRRDGVYCAPEDAYNVILEYWSQSIDKHDKNLMLSALYVNCTELQVQPGAAIRIESVLTDFHNGATGVLLPTQPVKRGADVCYWVSFDPPIRRPDGTLSICSLFPASQIKALSRAALSLDEMIHSAKQTGALSAPSDLTPRRTSNKSVFSHAL